jgi:hypothetical protein
MATAKRRAHFRAGLPPAALRCRRKFLRIFPGGFAASCMERERTFRPGAPTESARRGFEALVGHLRELRERGLIDLPERYLARVEDSETGAYLLAGPRHLTSRTRPWSAGCTGWSTRDETMRWSRWRTAGQRWPRSSLSTSSCSISGCPGGRRRFHPRGSRDTAVPKDPDHHDHVRGGVPGYAARCHVADGCS